MIKCAPSVRDRLLIGFLYGCGLRTGEVCNLRWRDLDTSAGQVNISHAVADENRTVPLPASILPVLERGKNECAAGDFVFPGGEAGKCIAQRTVERAIHRAARTAGLLKPVNCMVLRHSFAVASLKAGKTVREVQDWLGHKHVETTLRYENMLIAATVTSPADRLNVSFPDTESSDDAPTTSQAPVTSVEKQIGAPIEADFKTNAELAVFPFAEIPFDFRMVFRSMRAFFRFG